MTPTVSDYRGRFAPSPTGPLHLGSLVAAMASYLDARRHDGQWLLRIEDVDQTRALPGAAEQFPHTLDALGFEWHGEILIQSVRSDRYADAIQLLKSRGDAFDCGCSRREITAVARPGPEGPVYPGTCRKGLSEDKTPRSVRLRVMNQEIVFEDRIAGCIRQNLARDVGDFVILRADGYTAYQLAVVVDDADQGINQVVRGADLLMSTPRQRFLQQRLGLNSPAYAHVPLVRGPDGHKLSKQDHARPVDPRLPLPALMAALAFLGQPLPSEQPADLNEFWRWAINHWDIAKIPKPTEL